MARRIVAGLGRPGGLPAAAIVSVLGALVGAAWSWRPSLWLDEVASLDAAQRSPGQLVALLGQVDAVHGAYYATLSGWTALVGTSPFAARSLSAIMAGLAAGGVVVLGTRLVDRRTGVLAGAVMIALPAFTWFGTEARSSAMVAAVTTWGTVALLHALDRGRWWPYALAMSFAGVLLLESLLLLPAHLVTVLVLIRARADRAAPVRRWVVAAVVAVVVASPVAYVSWSQRAQVWWITRPGIASLADVLTEQWFGGAVALSVVAWLAIWAVVLLTGLPRTRRLLPDGAGSLIALALPATLVPTVLLLLASRTVTPLWYPRYLAYSVWAPALLVGLAVRALGRGRYQVASIGLVVALAAPTFVAQRQVNAKDSSDWVQVADLMVRTARPGDAVLYVPATRHRSPRRAAEGYPASFAGLDDVGLATRGRDTAALYDEGLPVDQLGSRLDGVTRLWVLGTTDDLDREPATSVAWLTAHGWTVQPAWTGTATEVLLATRRD